MTILLPRKRDSLLSKKAKRVPQPAGNARARTTRWPDFVQRKTGISRSVAGRRNEVGNRAFGGERQAGDGAVMNPLGPAGR